VSFYCGHLKSQHTRLIHHGLIDERQSSKKSEMPYSGSESDSAWLAGRLAKSDIVQFYWPDLLPANYVRIPADESATERPARTNTLARYSISKAASPAVHPVPGSRLRLRLRLRSRMVRRVFMSGRVVAKS